MAFRVYKGKPAVEYFTKGDTDLKIVDGSAVVINTSGQLGLPANDSDDKLIGVARKTIATTDSADEVPVLMASEDVVWEVETDSDGGATDTDVGRFCAIDTGDTTNPRATVDIDDSSVPHFLITQVVSSTKVRGRFARTTLRKPATHDLDT